MSALGGMSDRPTPPKITPTQATHGLIFSNEDLYKKFVLTF